VAKLQGMGSRLTAADWEGYRPEGGPALCSPWLGHTVLTVPPPLGGVTVLEALNLLAATGVERRGSLTTEPAAILGMVGALRVASADRSRWRGDPAHYGVPARGMSHPAFATARAGMVDDAPGTRVPFGDPWSSDSLPAEGGCAPLDPWGTSRLGRDAAPPAPNTPAPTENEEPGEAASHTSHFSVVDADHNAVALTFTVGVLFGSGVYVNGYFLNSGGSNFDTQTRGPSRFVSSTIAPMIVLDGDEPRLVIGAAGSAYIPTSVTQVAFRIVAQDEDPWLAIAAPRVQPSGLSQVEVEPGFAPAVYTALRERGFVTVSRVADITFGGVHAVALSRGGTLIGVADPRRDGAAMGW
jgi:gamma-glutamyltranspeptidase/glutathione hydrolase